MTRLHATVVATFLLWAVPVAGGEEAAVGFLRARDEAWRSKLPGRLVIEETWSGYRRITRRTVLWDKQLEYVALVEEREDGTLVPTMRHYASFVSGRWFFAAADTRGSRGWKGQVSEKNPNGDWKQSIWTLWSWPVDGVTVEYLLTTKHVAQVAKDKEGLTLFVAPDDQVLGHYSRDARLGGFAGWWIRFESTCDWRPVWIEWAFTVFKIAKKPTSTSVPRRRINDLDVDSHVRLEFYDWRRLGEARVPCGMRRVVIVNSAKLEHVGRVTEWSCDAAVINELPDDVTFATVPPASFGSVGVVRDNIRGVSEVVRVADGTPRTIEEEIVDELAKHKAPSPSSGWVLPSIAIGLFVLLAGAIRVWIWQKKARAR